ncbi:hypothetical protein FMM80_07245 [Schaedlerella arabinosiphila]|uniref:Uncharacterized protein n=1 Tax=Schaedlerella arabinosiphila TaxID=2044587 RepID=A0A9X5C653_9FIRM|nr:hypothetical protein [Schaedlerella arabinosiphila]
MLFSKALFVLWNCRPCVPLSVLHEKSRCHCKYFLSVRHSQIYHTF